MFAECFYARHSGFSRCCVVACSESFWGITKGLLCGCCLLPQVTFIYNVTSRLIMTAWLPHSVQVYGIFFTCFYCPEAKIESVIPYFGLQVYSEHFKLIAVKQTHPDTEI